MPNESGDYKNKLIVTNTKIYSSSFPSKLYVTFFSTAKALFKEILLTL